MAKLYGIGVGLEILTSLKAMRIIKESDVIAVPGTDAKDTVAYKIVVPGIPRACG